MGDGTTAVTLSPGNYEHPFQQALDGGVFPPPHLLLLLVLLFLLLVLLFLPLFLLLVLLFLLLALLFLLLVLLFLLLVLLLYC